MKEITYQPSALKALRTMPKNTAKRIIGKIESYAKDPKSQANNIRALKGSDGIRLRIGDWRVIMIEDAVINVLKIASRGSVY